MSGIIATIGSAIDLCKKLREVSAKVSNAELKNLIGDLSLNLADLKMELADMQEENLRLKKEIEKKKSSAKDRPNLVVRDGAYFFSEAQDGRPAGPYCTRCFDVEERLVLVSELRGPFSSFGKYRCNNCQAHLGPGV